MNKHPDGKPGTPSKDDILAFIRSQEGAVGAREIARAFGVRGSGRLEIKSRLRELKDEGKLASKRGARANGTSLPSVLVAEIFGRDADGEMLARPLSQDDDTVGTVIQVMASRRGPSAVVPGVGSRVQLRVARARGDHGSPPYVGRVMRVLQAPRARVLGIFRALPGGGGRLVPVDKKQASREFIVPRGQTADAVDGELVAGEPERSGRLGLTRVRVTERLGSADNERAISQIAIHAHDIPHVFPPSAVAEADAAQAADMRGREDWRSVPLVTIDPADAKDHDDAVHAQPDEDPKNPGGHVIDVAIADVASYVRPGSALDREALRRGNSVYFPDRVVPMLPERISNDLCSLRPDVDRPALAVRMRIDAHGRKRSHTFHRIMMRSHARLHYAQVQDAVDRGAAADDVPLAQLRALYAAYDALKRAREERGPLDLDLPERKILLNEAGRVDRVIVPPRLEAHRLIEEFMILANVAAAETLERARSPLLFRVHDEPAREKVEALRELLQTLDIPLSRGATLRPAQFNHVLSKVRGRDVEPLVNEVVLRTQAQAEYAAENYGHFGLNLPRYAHFTSPIRRYADVIVHRALISALKLGDDGLPRDADVAALADVAAKISAAERRAMAAERETADRLIAHYLADRIGATFLGRISGVTRAGLFVKLADSGADGFIPAATLGADYFRYEESAHALVGRSTGETHRLGDDVEVKLVEAAPVAGALRFELLTEGRVTRPQRGGRGASSHPGRKRPAQGSRGKRQAKRASRE